MCCFQSIVTEGKTGKEGWIEIRNEQGMGRVADGLLQNR